MWFSNSDEEDEWLPEEMAELIAGNGNLSPEDYVNFSMVSVDAHKSLMGFRNLTVSSIISRQTVHLILNTNEHVFLTGAAGTGKSHTLSLLNSKANELGISIGMTATTGMASTNLPGGRTLHSFASIPTNFSRNQIDGRKLGNSNLEGLKILVIDEVSMLSPEVLEALDVILQARNRRGKLMGGVKIVFVGDFYQLGAVKAAPVFLSTLWKRMDPIVIEHTKTVRQSTDMLWYHDLNSIRTGNLTKAIFSRLCDRFIEVDQNDILDGKYGTVMYPTNAMCVDFNRKAFSRNKNPVTASHTANDIVYEKRGKNLVQTQKMSIDDARTKLKQQLLRVPKRVDLKHDALYVLTKNLSPPMGHMNGLICRYNEHTRLMHPLSVKDDKDFPGADEEEVEEEQLIPIYIHPASFTFRINETLYLEREQIPFRLAYALTLHSSQGMTLQKAVMDAGPSIFAPGQTYTGMSRTKTRKSLRFVNLDPRSVRVDKRVVEYMNQVQHSRKYIKK